MVASGAFAISIAEHNVVWFLSALAFGMLAFWTVDSGRVKPIRTEYAAAMTLALLLMFLLPLREPESLEMHFPAAFAHILVAVQVLLFFTAQRPGFLLSFCGIATLAVMLISGVVQGDATVLLRIASLVSLTTWALFIYSIWRTREGYFIGKRRAESLTGNAPYPSVEPEKNILPESAFWQGAMITGGLSLACLVLGLFLFFSAPRVNEKLAGWLEVLRGEQPEKEVKFPGPAIGPSTGPFDTQGWTDGQRDIRGRSAIQSNQQTALIVTFSEAPETFASMDGQIYMRGMAYSHLDAGVWLAAPNLPQILESNAGKPIELADPSTAGLLSDHPLPGAEIEQRVEPSSSCVSHVYFGLSPVIRLTAERAQLDEEGVVHLPESQTLNNIYTIRSRAPVYDYQVPDDARAEHPDYQRYVLATGVRPDAIEAVCALALKITAQCTTPVQKVRAISDYLRTHFGYTMKLDELKRSGDPIQEFLLSDDKNQRRGHCEYFASAFVVLCRFNKIPARLATGFVKHIFEKTVFEKSIAFTNADAHSWGEVFFKGIGWVPFDPTPAASSDNDPHTVAANAPPPSMQQPSESDSGVIQSTWRQLLGFKSADQHRMYSRMGSVIGVGFGSAGSILSGKGSGGWILAVLVWGILGAALAWLLQFVMKHGSSRRARTGASAQRTRAAVSFYNDLLQVLSRRGYVRRGTQTPREFAEFVLKRGGVTFQPVLTVTQVFETVRYGGEELTQEDFNRLQTALDSLRELTFVEKKS